MSAIYGLVRLDGREVTGPELEAMRAPMAYWGPDGGGEWREEGAGLGQLVAHHVPEDVHERGPVTVAGGTAVVTPAGRLDNRDELCLALGVPAAERPSTADGTLIALAYERWGEDAPRRLLGDWAFAAWHPRERRLVLARDHYGNTALYYYRHQETLAFASSLKGLLALPDVPHRLHEERLAQTLVFWIVEGESTLYEGIRRLPTARVLTFDGRGARLREYWSLDSVPDVRFGSDDEYVEAFVDVFSNAVRARLRSTQGIASTLSAGLDSGAVTAFAARELGQRRLRAYTSRPAYPQVAEEMPDRLVDEWPRAQLVAQRWPNVDHEEVRAETSLSGALARSLWVHDQPDSAVGNTPWIETLLARVRSAGAGVLLTGQSGNGGVSWGGDKRNVWRCLAAGDASGAMRALRHQRGLGRGGWRGAVWRGLVSPARQRALSELMRRDPTRQPAWHARLIAPEFASRLDLPSRVRASGWDPTYARSTVGELRLAHILPGISPVGMWWHECGAAHGLSVRDPTADVRVLEFCFGTPEEQFASAGRDRWLMRRALEGMVPEEVAWNRRRGLQGADIAWQMRTDEVAVSASVDLLLRSGFVRNYIDVEAIARRWQKARSGGSQEVGDLASTIHVGVFLLRFME
ncbi:MAG: hypothetical protein QOF55_2641 [Thermoleophilaceae bacterium]|nr:hypothetical protein [Thermoleophilaceae bacterium]